jgi:disulfide bond formation protein DsbB
VVRQLQVQLARLVDDVELALVTAFAKARFLALALPSALMAGAWGSQYIGGLYPCEMCMWQRWPHEAAVVLALFAFAFRKASMDQIMVALAALAILASGAIGAFHAGVEYKWWDGITPCSVTAKGFSITDIMAAPMVRCDEPQWSLAGISLAGFNAIFSIGGSLLIFRWLFKGRSRETA